jgi:hypothetical protein
LTNLGIYALKRIRHLIYGVVNLSDERHEPRRIQPPNLPRWRAAPEQWAQLARQQHTATKYQGSCDNVAPNPGLGPATKETNA